MFVHEEETNALVALGQRLRARRIERQDTQTDFARRLGVSVPTYRKMEQGDPRTPIGHWARALRLLDGLPALDDLLPVSLFSEGQTRQRVRRP